MERANPENRSFSPDITSEIVISNSEENIRLHRKAIQILKIEAEDSKIKKINIRERALSMIANRYKRINTERRPMFEYIPLKDIKEIFSKYVDISLLTDDEILYIYDKWFLENNERIFKKIF